MTLAALQLNQEQFLPLLETVEYSKCDSSHSTIKPRDCGEPAISHDSHHVSLVQWNNLFASRHKGHRFKSPGGYLCETGILLLMLSRYIGDPDVIDHQQGFVPNCH